VKAPWEIIEHPADIGFIARGATLEELFANAAHAMMALACSPEGLGESERREIEVTAADHESLLFAWLAEILAIADAEQLFFRRAEVRELKNGRALGAVYGERYDKSRHQAGTYIKAVTYHQLRVEPTPAGWQATVYLDV